MTLKAFARLGIETAAPIEEVAEPTVVAERPTYNVVDIPGKGHGLVATQDFAAGDTVVISSFITFSDEETAAINDTVLANYTWNLDGFETANTEDTSLTATVLGDGNLLNHEENANCEWSFDRDKRLHTVTAAVDIKAGQELTLNYGWFSTPEETAAYLAGDSSLEVAAKGFAKLKRGNLKRKSGGKRKGGGKRKSYRSRDLYQEVADAFRGILDDFLDNCATDYENGKLDHKSFESELEDMNHELSQSVTPLLLKSSES